MVSTTMLQAQKIEEDMVRYMKFSSNVRDSMASPVVYRAMEEHLEDARGLTQQQKVSKKYVDLAEKKIKKEKTLDGLCAAARRGKYSA